MKFYFKKGAILKFLAQTCNTFVILLTPKLLIGQNISGFIQLI